MRTERHFIVCPRMPIDSIFKPETVYKMLTEGAKGYVKIIDRELAEGPTIWLPDNYYGPVELWPLVIEEGVEYALPR